MSKRTHRNVFLVALFAAAVSVANMGVGVAMAQTPVIDPGCGGVCSDSFDCGHACACYGSWPNGACK